MEPVRLKPRCLEDPNITGDRPARLHNRAGILPYFTFLLLLACPLCCFSQNGIEDQLPAIVFPPRPIELQEPVPVLPVLAAQPTTTPHHPKTFDKKHDLGKIGARGIGKGFNLFSNRAELSLGRDLASQVKSTSQLLTDATINEYISRIGQNVGRSSDVISPLTIQILDSEEVNAFSFPGGFVFVTAGLLREADDEAEVAGVLAHEIGHIAARHGTRNASKGMMMKALVGIAVLALHGKHGTVEDIVSIAGNIAAPLAFLHFSRGYEEEADLLALQYLYAAGYDPGSYVGFFEKLAEKKRPNFLVRVFSTHPPTSDRIKRCQRIVNEYFPDKEAYQVTTSEFATIHERLVMITGLKNRGPELRRRTPH